MKKLSLHSLLLIACFAFITSCSKDVKSPVGKASTISSKKTGSGTTTTTNTSQTTQTQPNCGSGSSCPSHSGSCGGGSTSASGYSGYTNAGH